MTLIQYFTILSFPLAFIHLEIRSFVKKRYIFLIKYSKAIKAICSQNGRCLEYMSIAYKDFERTDLCY